MSAGSDAVVHDVAEDWQKLFSKTHKRDYWFRSIDGTTTWEDPATLGNEQKKRRSDNDGCKAASSGSCTTENIHQISQSETDKIEPEIAIIVPYRDLHKEQCRKQQLDKFIPSISKFMESVKRESTYRVYIIEQSNDERKFNRGKLLNIGFQIACAEGCKALIFHDVDLLPSAGKLHASISHLTFDTSDSNSVWASDMKSGRERPLLASIC